MNSCKRSTNYQNHPKMAPTCQIPYELRVKIITLQKEGHSIRQISKKLTLSISGVAKTIYRYRDTDSNYDRPRSGAPRKTSQREEKFLEVTSKRNRFKTVRELTAELNTFRETPVSESTVRRRLAAKNLKGYIAAKKPLLRAINKKKKGFNVLRDTKTGQKRTGKEFYLRMNQSLKYLETSAANLYAVCLESA